MASTSSLRRPHPRHAKEKVIGPSCITVSVLATVHWGWANLYEPLSVLHADRALTFVIVAVELAGVGALSCMAYCLVADPGSTVRWRIRNPSAACTPCKVCSLPRPADAHHCRTCDQCVVGHDHHCCVLGVCIAERNRVCFIVLLGIGAFSFASMAALAACTYTWLGEAQRASGRAADPALLTRYAVPGAIFSVAALVLGAFGLLQLVCLRLGLRSKTPGLLGIIARELSARLEGESAGWARPPSSPSSAVAEGAAAKAAINGEHDDDALAEPGCCACIDAHHRWGLGGVVPGASLVLPSGEDETDSSPSSQPVRILVSVVAVIEWTTAAYLLLTYGEVPVAIGLVVLVAAAALSVWCINELCEFQQSRALPDSASNGRHFPRGAALVPQPTAGSGGELVLSDADENLPDGAAASEQRLVKPQIAIEWCTHCELYVMRPSAHCRRCNRCVPLMDHHCTLLRVCVGSENRVAYILLLGGAFALMLCYLIAAIPVLPHACVGVAPLYAAARARAVGAGGGLDSARAALAVLSGARVADLASCAPPAMLAAFCSYASWALVAFAFQQLLFVYLVEGGGGARLAEGDWRRWILRSVCAIAYWRRQREQVLQMRAGRIGGA